MKLAGEQQGIVTMAQARELGLTVDGVYRRVRGGVWQRLAPSTFRVCPGTSSWHEWLMALTRWSGGVASHRSAAALHDLDGFEPGALEISTVRNLRAPDSAIGVHRVPFLPADSVTVLGIPTVSASHALLAVAGVAEEDTVELALEDALRR